MRHLARLIWPHWTTVSDAHGRPHLDDPDDFVRIEIEVALQREIRVIPVLVDGAMMPEAHELPASLAKLARRQALKLSPSRFEFDTNRLLRVLDRTPIVVPPKREPEAPGVDAGRRRQDFWGAAVGLGDVWVSNLGRVTVTGSSPSSAVTSIKVGSKPDAIAVGHGAVWVANGGSGTISRIS